MLPRAWLLGRTAVTGPSWGDPSRRWASLRHSWKSSSCPQSSGERWTSGPATCLLHPPHALLHPQAPQACRPWHWGLCPRSGGLQPQIHVVSQSGGTWGAQLTPGPVWLEGAPRPALNVLWSGPALPRPLHTDKVTTLRKLAGPATSSRKPLTGCSRPRRAAGTPALRPSVPSRRPVPA